MSISIVSDKSNKYLDYKIGVDKEKNTFYLYIGKIENHPSCLNLELDVYGKAHMIKTGAGLIIELDKTIELASVSYGASRSRATSVNVFNYLLSTKLPMAVAKISKSTGSQKEQDDFLEKYVSDRGTKFSVFQNVADANKWLDSIKS